MDEPSTRGPDDERGLAFATLEKLLEMRGLSRSLAPELAEIEQLVAMAEDSGDRGVDAQARRAIRDLQDRAMRIMPAMTPADRRRPPDRGASATGDRSVIADSVHGPATASLDDADGSRTTHAAPARRPIRLP